MAGGSLGEFHFYLVLPAGLDGFGFGIQLDFSRLFLYGDLYGGSFSIGGADGDSGGSRFLSGDFAGWADSNFLVGSNITQLFVRSVCRKEGLELLLFWLEFGFPLFDWAESLFSGFLPPELPEPLLFGLPP